MQSVEFSILMTTYNRPDQLGYCLESIARQGIGDMSHEVLVLDDGNEDKTQGVAESFNRSGRLNVRHILTGTRTNRRWRNMGFAANIGIQQARGHIVVLTNSDIYHVGATVRPVIAAASKDAMAMSSLHEVWDDDGRLIEALRRGETDQGRLGKIVHAIKTAPRPRGFYPANPDVPFFLAIRRSHLLYLGGYDEDFIGTASEDCDLLDRLKAIGGHYVYAGQGTEAFHLYHGRKGIKELNLDPGFAHNIRLREERKNIIVRNRGRRWGELLDFHAPLETAPIHLVLFVTSICDRACPLCNQAITRRDLDRYNMTATELEHFIASCQARKIHFSTIELSGGEPTIWPLFDQAIPLLQESGITDRVTFITNGRDPEQTADIANRYGVFYVVSKSQCTPEQASIHARTGVGVVWNDGGHRATPAVMLDRTLPAQCSQRRDMHGRVVRQLMYLRGMVMYCCMAYPNGSILGDARGRQYMDGKELWCRFDDDFPAYFTQRPDMLPICSICLCNKNVWDQLQPCESPSST